MRPPFEPEHFVKKLIYKMEDTFCNIQYSLQNILELLIFLTENMTIIIMHRARVECGGKFWCMRSCDAE